MTIHSMTPEQEITYLREQNAKLRAQVKLPGNIKVSTKGAVSVYGLQKWPVTLYAGQWERLLAMKDQLEEFMVDHADELATKE